MSADQAIAAYELAYLIAQLALLIAVTGAAVWVYFTFWR
jgi:hypothetical protein